jgi:hypothetical protein
MSAKNSPESKRRRREEREARKTKARRRIALGPNLPKRARGETAPFSLQLAGVIYSAMQSLRQKRNQVGILKVDRPIKKPHARRKAA